MKLARGFKAYAERCVAGLRAELELTDRVPIDMHELCAHLRIPFFPLSRCLTHSGASRTDPHVMEIYSKTSAMTTFNGPRRTIIYNEEHSAVRHRSNMAHELAHALLQHPPLGEGVEAEEEQANEAEASWMSGVLMLTAAQARSIASCGMNWSLAQDAYQLSAEMLRFRMNVTGATKGT
jgi:hypothetical protein